MNLRLLSVFSWIAGMVALAATASAAVKTEVIEYREGDTVLEGYLAYDPAAGVRPGILVVHQWMGLGDYEKKRCEMLAELGYTAFAVDIYGKGVRPGTPADAGKLAGQYKGDRALFRRRLAAGQARFRQVTSADASKTAAIGYCFGGTGVLELARSGANLRGVVSFHGGLSSPTPADATHIKARVLACHGADDPFVPAEEVAGFEKEMREANVDWQLIAYGGAVHSFTDWRATGAMKGAQYNEKADHRSWAAMHTFLGDVFR